MGQHLVKFKVTEEEFVLVSKRANSKHMTLPNWARMKLELPPAPELRGRPRKKMTQAPLFPDAAKDVDSSKRATDAGVDSQDELLRNAGE
jgi:hypothetical protein